MEKNWIKLEIPYSRFNKLQNMERNDTYDFFRISKLGVYISDEGQRQVEVWKKDKVEVGLWLISYQLPKAVKRRIMNELKVKDLIVDSWEASIAGGIWIHKETVEILQTLLHDTKGNYEQPQITIGTAIRKYGISETKLRNAAIMNRLMIKNEKLNVNELEDVLKADDKLIALSDVLGEYQGIYDVKLTQGLKMALKDYFLSKKCWGHPFLIGEHVLKKDSRKDDIYLERFEGLNEIIDRFVSKNAKELSVSAYGYMWKHLGENTKEIICKVFDVHKDAPNLKCQPMLHKVMAVFVCFNKDIEEWLPGDLEAFVRMKVEKKVKSNCRRVLREAKSKFKMEMHCDPDILRYYREECIRQKEAIIPYTYDQFIMLGVLLFNESDTWRKNLLEKGLENAECAQVLLFMAFHYVCAWRMGDIIDFNVPPIAGLERIITELKDDKVEHKSFEEIWRAIEKAWYMDRVASKNSGELILRAPLDFYARMGMFICMAEYHRIRKGAQRLMDVAILCNVKNYEKTFGKECWNALFGNKPFRNRRMNKEFLILHAKGVKNQNYTDLNMMPEMVAAYLRGHKLDFEKGQETILRYIGHMSDGLSVDEVSYQLFLSGSFGYYRGQVAKILDPTYASKNLIEQVEIINELKIEPALVEMQLEAISDLNANLKKLGLVNDFNVVRKVIADKMNSMSENANEPNVFCLFEALTGLRNPDCIGMKNCQKCNSHKDSLLCQYGIYSWQYIYNLIFEIRRKKQTIQKLEDIKVRYSSYTDEYHRLENTINREIEVLEYLDDICCEFIQSVDFDEGVKENLILLYEKEAVW